MKLILVATMLAIVLTACITDYCEKPLYVYSPVGTNDSCTSVDRGGMCGWAISNCTSGKVYSCVGTERTQIGFAS